MAKRLPGISYFGIRRPEEYPDAMMQLIEAAPMYADLTAGSGRLPLFLSANMPVAVNDRVYYSAVSLKAVLEPSDNGYDIDDTIERVHPRNLEPFEGELTWRSSREQKPVLKRGTAAYVDALCNDDDLRVRASTAGVLVSACAFRGRSWTRQSSGYNGLVDQLSKSFFHGKIERHLRHAFEFAQARPFYNTVTNLDALDAPGELDFEPGTVVYIDPAWPYIKQYGANPYSFYQDVSSLICDDELPPINLWQRDQKDEILEEVASWVDAALTAGAEYVIVSNQDTNFPTPKQTYKRLREEFEERDVIKQMVYSRLTHSNYHAYFGIYQ